MKDRPIMPHKVKGLLARISGRKATYMLRKVKFQITRMSVLLERHKGYRIENS